MLGNLACWLAVALTGTVSPDALIDHGGSLQPDRSSAVVRVPAADSPRLVSLVIALKQPGSLRDAPPVASRVEVGVAPRHILLFSLLPLAPLVNRIALISFRPPSQGLSLHAVGAV